MPGATVAKLAAGTQLQYEDPNLAGTYKNLPGVLQIGTVGESGEFIETTPIDKTTREYIPGITTPDDKEIVMNDLPGDANQQEFLGLANTGATSKMKVVYTNGRTGDFTLALNGSKVNNPETDGQITISVFGRQSGATTWTIA